MSTRGSARGTYGRGAVYGTLAALVAATAWYVLAELTNSRQPYAIAVVGVAAAWGVSVGAKAPGSRASLLAVAITAVVLTLGAYWVERSLIIADFEAHGDRIDIPLAPYFDWWWSVLRHRFTASVLPAVFGVVAMVVAGFFGYHGFDHDEPPPTAAPPSADVETAR